MWRFLLWMKNEKCKGFLGPHTYPLRKTFLFQGLQ